MLFDKDEVYPDTRFHFANLVKINPAAEWWNARDELVLVTELYRPNKDKLLGERLITWYYNHGEGNIEYMNQLCIADDCNSSGEFGL